MSELRRRLLWWLQGEAATSVLDVVPLYNIAVAAIVICLLPIVCKTEIYLQVDEIYSQVDDTHKLMPLRYHCYLDACYYYECISLVRNHLKASFKLSIVCSPYIICIEHSSVSQTNNGKRAYHKHCYNS